MKLPTYPVYVISKGRADCCLTAKFLLADGVPFSLVVEPQEFDAYAANFGGDPLCTIVTTPFSNLGQGGIPARNFVWEHSVAAGTERHWILDDNIRDMYRLFRGSRLRANAGPLFAAAEEFIRRYENIAVAGFNYVMFAIARNMPPFYRNVHVYSCLCIQNDLPFRWRGRYNEDTDLCLQALSRGWCTVLFNAFLIMKMPTLTMRGGNTAELYAGDGRLRMARALERQWPGVVETRRRFGRPQHFIKGVWSKFTTPLKLRDGVQMPTGDDEFGMQLQQMTPEIRSPRIRALLESAGSRQDPEAQPAERKRRRR